MNKKYFLILLLTVCTMLVALAGCAKSSLELSGGTYQMKTKDRCETAPTVTFDLKENTFSFTFDFLSSYANIGIIEVKEDCVVATTNDKNNTYTFAIVDGDTLRFVAKDSDETKTVEGKVAVADGAEFNLTGK